MIEAPESNFSPSPPPPRRQRRGKKRVHFQKMPTPKRPLLALWEAASEEERAAAHRRCTVILEYWLGRITKAAAGEKLSVPQIRVFQLSQQALSGMGAALLRQPRSYKAMVTPLDPHRDPKVLRKRIAQLEMELRVARDLINLLKELPGNRERAQRHEQRRESRKRKREALRGGEAPGGELPGTTGGEPGSAPAAKR